ncbi:MAG: hypothetical protein ACRC3I_00765 [Cetobacterium sp.]
MLGGILNITDNSLILILTTFSIFSKNAKYITIAFIFKMAITEIAGKTTEFNINVIATIGITISLGLTAYFINENRNLKRKGNV